MYIVFFLYTLISSTAFCETTWLEDGTLLEDFIVVNKGHMGYPICECADTCRRHLSCITFNYNWNTRACELVDQNFDEFEADVEEPGWYNYGTHSKIDGGWSNWFESSPCSATCGYGLQTQYRTCTAPEPKYGGEPCIGNEVQTVSCKIVSCPIDRGLSDGMDETICIVSCDGRTSNGPGMGVKSSMFTGGEVLSNRCLIKRSPQSRTTGYMDGRHFILSTSQLQKYCGLVLKLKCLPSISQVVHASIDGGLSDWINDTDCTVSCGGGTLTQVKICTNPVPQFGGKDCPPNPTQTVTCNVQKCPCIRHKWGCCSFPTRYGGKVHHKCWRAGTNFHCKDAKGILRTCV